MSLNYTEIEITMCPSSCDKCTGVYFNTILESKIVCKCSCHDKKNDVADGFREPDSATSSQEPLEFSQDNGK